MPEYIEREAAIKFVKEQMEETNNKTAIKGSYVTQTYNMAIRHAVELLRYVPTAYPKADVVEVRHGKWIGEPSVTISANKGRTIRSTIYKCSLCNKTNGRIKKLYCPNCGARMDGGTNDDSKKSARASE